MRKPIIAGNWKMNKTRDEALSFMYAVCEKVPSNEEVETVICSPATNLRCLVKRQGPNLRVAAQNMHYAESGAFTGEISPKMLVALGVEYVVIGHSERRAMFNETDETVNKKTIAAIENNITPIVCCGEELEARENGTTNDIVKPQIIAAFNDISATDAEKVVIAYEPIWAIGTGKTATAEQAEETCAFIRSVLSEIYSQEVADSVRIQYGGSVTPENVKEIMSKENIDGVLVGGASLNPTSFLALCDFNK